jgi:hypothetical protein
MWLCVTQEGHRPKPRHFLGQTRRGSGGQTWLRSVAALTRSTVPLTLASRRVASNVDVRIERRWVG